MQMLFKAKNLGLIFITLVLLFACGQKRDLYLPEAPASNKPIIDSDNSSERSAEGKG